MKTEHRGLLLIEDSDEHAELTSFYISEHRPDITVTRVADGGAAMAYLDSVRNQQQPMPWLCILDLQLPKYDGHEILAAIKTDALLKILPVVVFTTSAAAKDIRRALENHANSVITKPMGADRYEQAIESILSYWALNQHHLAIPRS